MSERSRLPPPKPSIKRKVVIPSTTFVGEDEGLATFRLGLLARYMSSFRVEEVVVFGSGSELIVDVLRYAEAPPYLKRRLFRPSPTLRYVGVIPPLQGSHHPPSSRGAGFSCEYREGVVLSAAGDYLVVDVGLSEPIKVEGRGEVGSRVTVLMGGRPKVISREAVPYYWGFKVIRAPSLRSALEASRDYLRVATSRLGIPIGRVGDSLVRDAEARGRVAIFFGDRDREVFEIAREEGLEGSCFEYTLNFVPHQGCFTIRTEEAVPIVLSILDYLLEWR